MEPKDPPLPRIVVANVVKLRTRIIDTVALDYYEDAMDGKKYAYFCRDMRRLLRPKGVSRPVIDETCRLLQGHVLTEERLHDFAWRVAGNLATLVGSSDPEVAGRPLGPSRLPAGKEWAAFQVGAALLTTTKRGKVGCEFTLKALSGAWCPGTLAKFWTREAYTYLAKEIGFSPPWGPAPFQHPMQFVGLRLCGLLDPDRVRDGKPDFRETRAPPSFVGHNRSVLAIRNRQGEGNQCPRGFNGAKFVPCHRCWAGYLKKGDDKGCKAACHPRDYEPRPCLGCGRDEAPFDTGVSNEACIECVVKQRTAPKKKG